LDFELGERTGRLQCLYEQDSPAARPGLARYQRYPDRQESFTGYKCLIRR
jgi:hypothetical protein